MDTLQKANSHNVDHPDYVTLRRTYGGTLVTIDAAREAPDIFHLLPHINVAVLVTGA
ncbi:MAG TPA: hypothetical protein VGP65_03990 [Candidatus Angelobacter sp.]|nr:hypothetical protein [Candidatus Angelobacter sp.]